MAQGSEFRVQVAEEGGPVFAGTLNPEPRHSGFTLIELMVVLVGLAVVAAAVVPAMRGAGSREDLDSAATRVAASARFAREAAVERQETLVLTVETEPPHVRLMVEEEIETGPTSTRMRDQEMPAPLPNAFAAVRLPPRVMAHLEPAPEDPQGTAPAAGAALPDGLLRFPPDGRPTGGVIVLMDDRGRERRVLVTPDTGVVRIETEDSRLTR